MPHDVFLSHVADARNVADAACAALEARGFACWVEPRDLLPGQGHGDATAGAIARAKALVLILSAASAKAPYVQREVARAAEYGVPILVFRLAEVALVPSLAALLEDADTLDALTPPVAPHLDYLGDQLARLIEAGRPGRALTEPPRPFRADERRRRSS